MVVIDFLAKTRSRNVMAFTSPYPVGQQGTMKGYGSPYSLPPNQQEIQYTVAWICALPLELAAARAMLDELHEIQPRETNDSNTYTFGSVGAHNIVVACLPSDQYGTNNAANVLTHLVRTFHSVRFGLMVGIGGGVPGVNADVRLGDVVVGSRVMQCDLGKVMGDGHLLRTAVPKLPPHIVTTAISSLRAKDELQQLHLQSVLNHRFTQHAIFHHPNLPDQLFEASYEHKAYQETCDACDRGQLRVRRPRDPMDIQVHHGVIASGNQVMKNGTSRDRIAQELGAICFEMEAAGLMDILPCLAIRGICDYSDSHKNKRWQKYAAATAAAYARELLLEMPAGRSRFHTQDMQVDNAKAGTSVPRRSLLLNSLEFQQREARKATIKKAHTRTCSWFLNCPDYLDWLDPDKLAEHHGFLWISGKPGAGKSTIMKFVYEKRRATPNSGLTASFFFNARGERLEKTVPGLYRSLLLQLLQRYPDLQSVLEDSDIVPPGQRDCPELNVLKDLFSKAVLQLGTRLLTCFIDALDECDEQQMQEMVQYFEDLAEESVANDIHLRICFASRHYPYVNIQKGIRLTLEKQDGHGEDLYQYTKSTLRVKSTNLAMELIDKLVERSQQVFLWIVLVVPILNKEAVRGRFAMHKKLEELPVNLNDLFRDIITRDEENQRDLMLCLQWLLCSSRPLSPKEYHHAIWAGLFISHDVSTDPNPPRVSTEEAKEDLHKCVVTTSKGLAEITKSRKPTVQFIHESVRDFLLLEGGLEQIWPDIAIDGWSGLSHETLKRACHAYCQHSRELWVKLEDDIMPTLLDAYPFLEYAIQNILHHANVATNASSQHDFSADFHEYYCWIKLMM